MGLADGAANLMAALTGGGQIESDARLKREMLYDQQDAGRAELDRKMTEALLKRDQRVAQQRQRDVLMANGMDPATADVAANSGIAGFANLTQMQEYDQKHRAEAAFAADPQFSAGNAILAAVNGKPLPTIDIQDGNEIRGQYGANPTITPTQQGMARIGAENALAGERNAHAGVYRAQEAVGGYNPNTGRGRGAAGKPEAYTDPGVALLRAALGGDDDIVSAEELAPFAQWRNAHPEYRDGQQALSAYLDPGLKNLHPLAQAMQLTDDNGGTAVAPAGTDADLVGELTGIARDAAAQGRPLSKGQLRAIAELRARGLDFHIGADGRVVAADSAPAAPAPVGGDPKGSILAEARAAIAAGKDPQAVRARLVERGHADLAGML